MVVEINLNSGHTGKKCGDDRQREKFIEKVIKTAEKWCDNQSMLESSVCMSALKDIRRVVRTGETHIHCRSRRK